MKELVITGGNGGLGGAIAREFVQAEWEVFAPGRDALDVTDPDAVQRVLCGRSVDLLICAAGIISDAPLIKMEESAWDEVLAVNLTGAATCAAAVIPGMVARGHGHVVLISSYAALRPAIGQAAYATSKAALHGLATSLARNHGPAGVRVNVVLPGFMQTRMTSGMTSRRQEEVISSHALKRLNTPEVVARFIRRLDNELPHTSGQVFQLDSRIP